MRAGLLKESIIIQELTSLKDGFGAINQSWANKSTVRAQVTSNNSTRKVENDEIVNPYTLNFIVRYHIDIQDNNRIIYDNKKYRILSIQKNLTLQMLTIIGELINE